MRLKSFAFCQDRGGAREWQVERFDIDDITLLVGKNASGKTKTLNALTRLSQLLAGAVRPVFLGSAEFDAHFDDGGKPARYELVIGHNSGVTREVYSVAGTTLLNRGEAGEGTIFAHKERTFQSFQAPKGELAAFNRRDAIQHPFFQPLYDWAINVIRYNFGTQLGKDHFAMIAHDQQISLDWRDSNQVIGLFRKGRSLFPETYTNAIAADMKSIGYDLESITTAPPVSVSFDMSSVPAEVVGLAVKERSLPGITDQLDMSQGMFRALSLIAQVNFAIFSEKPSCVLIDDIGEGLDFERSCGLVRLLTEKARSHSIQVILSTNDKFVMNAVPLESWAVLQRSGSHIKIHNYANSKDIFEKFRMTGLNNFDFLATNFLNEAAELDF